MLYILYNLFFFVLYFFFLIIIVAINICYDFSFMYVNVLWLQYIDPGWGEKVDLCLPHSQCLMRVCMEGNNIIQNCFSACETELVNHGNVLHLLQCLTQINQHPQSSGPYLSQSQSWAFFTFCIQVKSIRFNVHNQNTCLSWAHTPVMRRAVCLGQ